MKSKKLYVVAESENDILKEIIEVISDERNIYTSYVGTNKKEALCFLKRENREKEIRYLPIEDDYKFYNLELKLTPVKLKIKKNKEEK